ncbi:hypothetical protein BJ912DRAFT_1047976 [Pholiota molesta]|nr:hypothetical protein BJ912DRAFT_1047976 [Pholiota molesta]
MIDIAILNDDEDLNQQSHILLQKAQEAIEFLGSELPAEGVCLILKGPHGDDDHIMARIYNESPHFRHEGAIHFGGANDATFMASRGAGRKWERYRERVRYLSRS